MKLHPKILELRSKVGTSPIHRFIPKTVDTRSPKINGGDDDELTEIDQYFCIFGVPDDYGTVPVKGCFAKSIEERGPKSNANYKIVVLWQHDQRDPLCLPKILEEDEVGLRGVYTPDDVPSGVRACKQIRSGTINQGSYGFNYVWEAMEYDSNTGLIMMHECKLFEVSPVTIGSQQETFVKRNSLGFLEDEYLIEDTEDFIKTINRKDRLQLRSLIDRHIALAKVQNMKTLDEVRSPIKQLDLNYLISKL